MNQATEIIGHFHNGQGVKQTAVCEAKVKDKGKSVNTNEHYQLRRRTDDVSLNDDDETIAI